METKDMKLTIGHLYPDLLNLYGDRGNIACLMKRCIWRGIEAETIEFNTGDQIDFSKLDIVLLGGGSDREQAIVCKSLLEIQSEFKDYVEDTSIEDRFRAAEKKAEKKAKESVEAPADFLRAGFTPQLTEELARALLQLKMELYREDVKNYTFQIKRDGEKIVLIPKYKK